MESRSARVPIAELRAVIASNGFGDGPAQALRDFLLSRGAPEVWTIFHPLVKEGDVRHEITVYKDGARVSCRRINLPFSPPTTYPFDLLVPIKVPRADVWFGFNNLACLRGILGRRRKRIVRVVHWCVDFVPNRFGPGIATRAYDALDRYVCRRADARFELSRAALEGRNLRHGLSASEMAPAYVVPMGAWLDRVPVVPEDGLDTHKVAYMGHLVERQGVRKFIEAIGVLHAADMRISAEVIGGGPLLDSLRKQATDLGLSEVVRFRGFIEDFKEIEQILASSSIGVAPYATDAESFSRFADPGKLKAYLAAGLPIVLTDVPPNARELAERAGAGIVDFDAGSIAEGIRLILEDPAGWKRRRAAALSYIRQFDWDSILTIALENVGLPV